jgi:hypothetical protein
MKRLIVTRSRATDGRSVSECQGKRPDQALKRHSDGLECREPSALSHLGFQPFQKTPTIHASSGFIWGMLAETNASIRHNFCIKDNSQKRHSLLQHEAVIAVRGLPPPVDGQKGDNREKANSVNHRIHSHDGNVRCHANEASLHMPNVFEEIAGLITPEIFRVLGSDILALLDNERVRRRILLSNPFIDGIEASISLNKQRGHTCQLRSV